MSNRVVDLTSLEFTTTLHFEGLEATIPFVSLHKDELLLWDDGKTYTVYKTLFVLERHSGEGDLGLHAWMSEA